MTLTKDDLQAISELLGNEMADVKGKLEQLENGQKQLENRQKQLENGQKQVGDRLAQLENGQNQIERGLKQVEGRMVAVEEKLIYLDGNVRKIKIDMEQSILPRLQTIESCYLTSYHRIQLAADKIDRMDNDIEVIKNVVTKHSEATQAIA